MTHCPICNHDLVVTACACEACRTTFGTHFALPRLARLSQDEQQLAEALILYGGNLKEMAENLHISYPTLKKRLKELSTALETKKKEDEAMIEQILKKIELGQMNAEEGIKRIREINGEL